MNRLQKFVERGAYGEEPGRTAYAFGLDNLPPPGENLAWRKVSSFNAAEEVLRDADLKDVFKTAIAEGCAIVEKQTTGRNRRAKKDQPTRRFSALSLPRFATTS